MHCDRHMRGRIGKLDSIVVRSMVDIIGAPLICIHHVRVKAP
jgi:hypothetical protein